MPDDIMPQVIAHLFAQYGPLAIPIIVLGLIIKYLLDKDKSREMAHKEELKARKLELDAERAKNNDLQLELLNEARGNRMLAEDVKKILDVTLAKAP